MHGPPPRSYAKSLKKLPVVWLLQQGDFSYGDRVQTDHHAIGRLSAQYLMDAGLTHMACMYDLANLGIVLQNHVLSLFGVLEKNNVQVDVLSYDMDDQKLNPLIFRRRLLPTWSLGLLR